MAKRKQPMWNPRAQAEGYERRHDTTIEAWAPGCDCVHPLAFHDPLTGACLYTNPIHGPCPCKATPERTRLVLERVHRALKQALEGDQS